MRKLLKSLREDESAQNLIEYALVAALIALGAVASIQALSTAIGDAFTRIETQLNRAQLGRGGRAWLMRDLSLSPVPPS